LPARDKVSLVHETLDAYTFKEIIDGISCLLIFLLD